MTKTLSLVFAALVVSGSGVAFAAPPDGWITTKAKIALVTHEGVPSADIHVDTVNGLITLHGKVATIEEKRSAEDAAKTVDGSVGVRNLLQVVPSSEKKWVKRSDKLIQGEIEKLFKEDKTIGDIKVASVDKGVVLLEGRTDSLLDYLRAVEIARSVPGVRRVASEVTASDEMSDSRMQRDRRALRTEIPKKEKMKDAIGDAWMTASIKVKLFALEGVPALDINVDTRNGQVTLFGIVPTEHARRAAGAEAAKVASHRNVNNQLQVVPSSEKEMVKRSDDELKKDVSAELKTHPMLKDLDFAVKDGVVHLTGMVNTAWEEVEAARIVRSVKGVRAVVDGVRIRPLNG